MGEAGGLQLHTGRKRLAVRSPTLGPRRCIVPLAMLLHKRAAGGHVSIGGSIRLLVTRYPVPRISTPGIHVER